MTAWHPTLISALLVDVELVQPQVPNSGVTSVASSIVDSVDSLPVRAHLTSVVFDPQPALCINPFNVKRNGVVMDTCRPSAHEIASSAIVMALQVRHFHPVTH